MLLPISGKRAAKAEANKDSQRRQEPGNEQDELLSIFRNECRPLLWSGICARCLVGNSRTDLAQLLSAAQFS